MLSASGFTRAIAGRKFGWVVPIVLVSLLLRVGLVLQGGQNFFGDEMRFARGAQVYLAVQAGEYERARAFTLLPDHMLFTWISTGITVAQHAFASLSGEADWAAHPEKIVSTQWIGAALLSLFSTLNLALVFRFARTIGASEAEATWALLLMAVAQPGFYYARHLVPYDCALSFALLAMNIGWGSPSPWRAFACGALMGISYGIYNGYWFFVPVAWLGFTAFVQAHPRRWILILLCGLGAAVAIALPIGYVALVGGSHYWNLLTGFGGSATQGDFSEGWSLPFEYFWHAEGAAGIVGIGCVVAVLGTRLIKRQEVERRVAIVLLMIAAAYALLVLLSSGLHLSVVYARLMKPLVPLICLVGGWALAQVLNGRARLQAAVATMIVIVGALHFAPHFSRAFPREVEAAVLRTWGNPQRTLSIRAKPESTDERAVSRPDLVLVNAQILYPVRGPLGYPPGKTLLQFAHPLTFLPYQYEGFTPQERAILRANDISIRLIALPGSPEAERQLTTR
jgi:hypothetical protein